MQNISVYIHWPFCRSKCDYCNFVSVPCCSDSYDVFEKIISDIKSYKNILQNRKLVSVFFGGGTPSLLSPAEIEKILKTVFSCVGSIYSNVEVTLESNPGTFDEVKLSGFKTAGINRLSLGCQSFFDDDLKFLGRACDAKTTLKAAELVAKKFQNFSMDFIYGFNLQSPEKLSKNIETAVSFSSPHLSFYKLTIEENTPLYNRMISGEFSDISDDEEKRLYDLIEEILKSSNLFRYEISNYAKCGFESVHNLAYWNYNDYLGVGPSAHSRLYIGDQEFFGLKGKIAGENENNLRKWLNSKQMFYKLSACEIFEEKILMGLRTKYGVKKEILKNVDIGYFLRNEYLLEAGDSIKINPKLFHVSDYIINELLLWISFLMQNK